jgi:hypothetical protein
MRTNMGQQVCGNFILSKQQYINRSLMTKLVIFSLENGYIQLNNYPIWHVSYISIRL